MSPTLAALPLLLLCQLQAVSVSFDLRSLPEADYRRFDGLGMERKVTLRLIQEGLAVVSVDAPKADVRLAMVRTPQGLLLVAAGSGTELREEVRTSDARSVSLAELHLEIAQKASELARRLARTSAPSDLPTAPAEPAPAPPAHVSQAVEASASAGASWRGAGADPLLLVSVDGRLSAIRLGAEMGLSLLRPGDPALGISEVQGAVFVGHRLVDTAAWSVEPAVGAGVLVHSYQLNDPWASSTSGTIVSPAAWARLEAGFHLAPTLALGLRVAAAAVRPLSHVSEGETQWERSALRVETGARISWTP